MKHKQVYIMSGAPGCGKSTYIAKQIAENGGIHISRDAVRFANLKEGEYYFVREDEVFKKFVDAANAAIDNENGPDNIYVDATHLNFNSRNKILKRLHLNNADVNVVSFQVPLETCLERNAKRDGRSFVPVSAVRRMWYQQTDPATDGCSDHYNIIYVKE